MKRWKIAAAILAAMLLFAACGARQGEPLEHTEQPEQHTEQPEQHTEQPEQHTEQPEQHTEQEQTGVPAENVPREMLPGLNSAALADTMTEEDYEAFAAYLLVLEGKEGFRWVAGPYDGYPDYNWEPFEANLEEFCRRLWEGAEPERIPETLTLDRLSLCDIDRDGGAELALLFQDRAYHYLILSRKDGGCCGTSFSVRWFMNLQTNGVYVGSGGAGSSAYYRMTFRDGVFRGEELGHSEEWAAGSEYVLDGKPVTEADFDAWLAENLPGEVVWYAPDGSVIPENE